MTFLKILGWILVLFLSGSLLYSIKFHLGNYLSQRRKIKTGEVGEIYEQMHKEVNWAVIIFIQFAKLFLVILLLTYLLNGQIIISENTTNKDQQETIKWTEEIKTEFVEGCTGNTSYLGISKKHTLDYCNCVLAKTMEKYPDPEVIKTRVPWDFVVESGVDCIEKINRYDKDKTNKCYPNKQKFLFSVFAFKKAFEIEPSVETKTQQKEYEALIKIGVDLSYGVNDDFLNELHPELLNQYRQNLIQGGILLLKGNTTENDIDTSLKHLSDGADLVNNWSAWWNNHAVQLIDKLH